MACVPQPHHVLFASYRGRGRVVLKAPASFEKIVMGEANYGIDQLAFVESSPALVSLPSAGGYSSIYRLVDSLLIFAVVVRLQRADADGSMAWWLVIFETVALANVCRYVAVIGPPEEEIT